MSFLTILMLLFGLVISGALLLAFIGTFALETDKVKANRYLADLHDRDAGR